MFVALDENATKRPSPLTAWALELLGPFADAPLVATEIVTVEGVHPATGAPEELQVSWSNTSLVTPTPAAGICLLKTTKRPSSLSAGIWLLPLSALPALSTETMVVEGVHPLPMRKQVSRR